VIGGFCGTVEPDHVVLSSQRCFPAGRARASTDLRAQTIAPRTPQRVSPVML